LLKPFAGAASIFPRCTQRYRTGTAHAMKIDALNSRMAAAAQPRRDAIYWRDES
jgi:hypothetical protein